MPFNLTKLFDAMEIRGFTELDLAKRANVHVSSVNRLRRRQFRNPRPSTIKKLADAIGIDMRDIHLAAKKAR